MYAKLSIPERLKDLRVERHLTSEQLATETGLSKSVSSANIGRTETKNHPNTALHELHLSDDMIDVLKNGKLNNRLLCKMVTHKNFHRFLVNVEIYVARSLKEAMNFEGNPHLTL